MRVAVCGCGSIGQRHIRNLIALGLNPNDISAYDPSSDALLRVPDGVRKWPAETRPDDYQAVLICMPAAQHAEAIKIAIEHRCPFFIEKPATLGVSELTEAEWQTDVPHLVGYNWRFHERLKHVKVALGGRSPAACWLRCDTTMTDWPGHHYAAPLFECSHEIDLALWLCPDAELLTGVIGSDYANMCIGAAYVSIRWASKRSRRSFEFAMVGTPHIEPTQDEIDRSYLDEMRHFLAVARGDEPSINTLSQSRRVVEICEQASAMVAA
ncbi:MAG: Gfo/Idh/MocA family oxidoreductase [Acidobacteria bacterium]|nr:Gfo/Idh/MocA family oxidoreductase [Acidobacteriota bacterium]